MSRRTDPHPKSCPCRACEARRWHEYKARIDEYASQGIYPHSAEQTVLVREYTVHPHFRRNPRHLSKDERLKHHIESYLTRLAARKGATT